MNTLDENKLYLQEHSMFLSEAYYFGKNKELLRLEELFQEIIDNLAKNKLYNPNGSNIDKEMSSIIKKLFNFETVTINFSNPTMANAMTFGQNGDLIVSLDPKKTKIVQTNKGIKFKNSKNIHGYFEVYLGLITVTKLNAEEMVAILLHEIGHNFYNTFQSTILQYVGMVLSDIVNVGLNNEIYTKGKIDMNSVIIRSLLNIPFVAAMRTAIVNLNRILVNIDKDYFKGTFSKIKSLLGAVASTIEEIASLAQTIPPLIAIPFILSTNLIDMIFSDSYRNEKFADNFATMYGYSAAAASAFSKMELGNLTLVSSVTNKIPIVNAYLNTTRFITRNLFCIFDPHPCNDIRINEQIKLLEEYLKDNPKLNNSMKKNIQNQIQSCKESKKQLSNFKANIKKGQLAQFLFYKFRQATDSSFDIKEAMYKNKDYNWDNVIKDKKD